MIKYYTRACNFYYGNQAKILIKDRLALPLCGIKVFAFDKIEILIRNKNKISSRFLNVKDIKKLGKNLRLKVKEDLKKITRTRKNFIKNVDFSKPSIMGILNLTPDSFSDGGKFNNKKKSLKHISYMVESGAKIIDVGGESTRPGSKTIDPKVEWKRVEFVLKKFKKKFRKICLSLDTRKSSLMEMGLKNGVDLINDVSGFNYDQLSLKKMRNSKVPKVLHHMQGTPNTMQINPKYKNVLLDVYDFFEDSLNKKFKNKSIILDPGIGFGKTLKHNLILISKISLFHSLGLPIMIGTSKKKFIGQISGKHDSKNRTGGTLASILFLLLQGIQIFRVHDVNEINQGILVFNKILEN